MKNIVLILFIVLIGFANYSSALNEKKWSDDILVGYQFILDDKNIIEKYFFYSNGTVKATIGKKRYIFWPFIKKVSVSGPIYQWDINNKNELEIKDHENKIIKKLILKRIYENKYVVINNNKELTFNRIKLPTI